MSPGSQKSGLLQPKAKNHPQGQVSTLNLCAIGRVHGPVRGPKLAAAAFLQQTQSFFPCGGRTAAKSSYFISDLTHARYSFSFSSLRCYTASWITSMISLADPEVQRSSVVVEEEEINDLTALLQRRNLILIATDQSNRLLATNSPANILSKHEQNHDQRRPCMNTVRRGNCGKKAVVVTAMVRPSYQ